MDTDSLARLLRPVSVLLFVGGWAFAIASYFIVGTETCASSQVPLVGAIETCADTTSTTYVIVAAIGFSATIGALILWTMSALIEAVRSGANRGV